MLGFVIVNWRVFIRVVHLWHARRTINCAVIYRTSTPCVLLYILLYIVIDNIKLAYCYVMWRIIQLRWLHFGEVIMRYKPSRFFCAAVKKIARTTSKKWITSMGNCKTAARGIPSSIYLSCRVALVYIRAREWRKLHPLANYSYLLCTASRSLSLR